MYVVMYHYVRKIRNSRYPEIKGLEQSLFEEQLRFFIQHDFQFVTLQEVVQQPEHIGEKSVLLTFDDGYIDHYQTVFPILDRYGIQGVFSMPGKIIREKKVLDVNKIHFVLACADIREIKARLFSCLNYYRGAEFDFPSNQELYQKWGVANRFDSGDVIFVKRILQAELPEKLRNLITDEFFREFVTDHEAAFVDELYMNQDQIETMKKHGMEFGIHGYDHYWMNRLSEEELRLDIARALDVFDGIIDPQNWCCCYPYGSHSPMVIHAVKQLGAVSGLATETACYHPLEDDIYKIPRLDTNDFPPKSENYLTKGGVV